MKRTLSEELERIHSLTYGNQVINEEGFLDKILQKVGLKKTDDPKKADLVSDDVNEFFKTLEDSSNSGGLSQQKRGSMSFQKGVESMQIGLILLGYELPRYGVDGLFGPETANAVSKFNQDNQILSEAVSYDAIGLIGKPGQGTHNVSDWQSRNAWDVKMSVGSTVKSITNGVISKVRKSGDGLTTSGKKKIYGDQVSVTSSDGPDVFYTHIDSTVTQGQNVSVGDEIGKIMTVSGMPPHVHIGLSYGNLSDYISNLPTATGGEGSPEVLSKATPEMLNKLIELLKERGVNSEDLQKHIDIVNLEGLVDQNFYAKLLENLRAPVSEENLKFLYAWRQAEGKGGKFNPFNTTWTLPGSTSMNSHGVKDYQSLNDGMVATIKTLKNGRYDCIVNGLRNDIGAEKISQCESLKTWGTGDLVAKVVSGYNRGNNPKIESLA